MKCRFCPRSHARRHLQRGRLAVKAARIRSKRVDDRVAWPTARIQRRRVRSRNCGRCRRARPTSCTRAHVHLFSPICLLTYIALNTIGIRISLSRLGQIIEGQYYKIRETVRIQMTRTEGMQRDMHVIDWRGCLTARGSCGRPCMLKEYDQLMVCGRRRTYGS